MKSLKKDRIIENIFDIITESDFKKTGRKGVKC